MIVDSHAYCFPPADFPAGFATAEDHLAWVQAGQAAHHQPAWRIRDRVPASSDVLAAPGGAMDFANLPEVDFHVDHASGRVVWTIDGEDHTKQFYPPNLRSLEFTPQSLLAEMDYAGVDKVLLHVDAMLGRDAAFQAKCVAAAPERIYSMAPVDEWRVATETDAVIAETTRAIREYGLHAIKFNPPHAYYHRDQPWDDKAFRPFWDTVSDLGVPVFFTLGTGPGEASVSTTREQQRAGYYGELVILKRWMERYPDVVCSITHGFPWRLLLDVPPEQSPTGFELPEELWQPFENPNLSLEVCFPVRIGDLFDFPWREVYPAFEQMVECIGADRLMWGTDMPFQNRFCTYRQSRRWIEGYCDFLTPKQVALILGGTAARLLGLG
ncbi:MAG: amidohydrolase family protein [Candidatus Latescibacterota bacterium]|nr:amidohydrolase family protein [Candidatus Latescibacterota bacterium]